MRVWLTLGIGAAVLTAAIAAHQGSDLRTATPQGVAAGSTCLVLRDLPFYDVVDAPPELYIPPRPPMRDPCAVRLLPVSGPEHSAPPPP